MPSLQIERPIEHDIAATRRLFDSDPCVGKLHVCNRRGPVVVGTTRAGGQAAVADDRTALVRRDEE